MLNWIRNVIYCALNYIPEPIKHTKLVFSAILLSFGRGSGWDQLLYVITELPASFLWPAPRFDPLCMEHAMSDLLWVQLGISQQTLTILQSMYSKAMSRIKLSNHEVTAQFRCEVGVRQGCNLTPLLLLNDLLEVCIPVVVSFESPLQQPLSLFSHLLQFPSVKHVRHYLPCQLWVVS